jgi:hypothetical protein
MVLPTGITGPAQLALGILLEEFGPAIAQTHYQHFKEDVVARLPNGEGDRWTLTSEQVNKWFTQYGTS